MIKKGCLFSRKNQRYIKIRVLFWQEISALGVFFNFDNERMRPPKYPSDPPGPFFLQNRGQAEVFKKDPFLREIRNAGSAPL